MEALNARFRQACLNEHWFLSVADAQERVDGWREGYNRVRPHSSPGNVTPEDFANRGPRAPPPRRWRQAPDATDRSPHTWGGPEGYRIEILVAGGSKTGAPRRRQVPHSD